MNTSNTKFPSKAGFCVEELPGKTDVSTAIMLQAHLHICKRACSVIALLTYTSTPTCQHFMYLCRYTCQLFMYVCIYI